MKESVIKHFPHSDKEFNKAYEELMEISRLSTKKDYSDIMNPKSKGSAAYHIINIIGFMRKLGNGGPTLTAMDPNKLLIFCSLLLDSIYYNSLVQLDIEEKWKNNLNKGE